MTATRSMSAQIHPDRHYDPHRLPHRRRPHRTGRVLRRHGDRSVSARSHSRRSVRERIRRRVQRQVSSGGRAEDSAASRAVCWEGAVSEIDLWRVKERIKNLGLEGKLIEAACGVANAIEAGAGGLIKGTLMEADLRFALCLDDHQLVRID